MNKEIFRMCITSENLKRLIWILMHGDSPVCLHWKGWWVMIWYFDWELFIDKINSDKKKYKPDLIFVDDIDAI